ncbi:uracil permease [Faecalibaculum rodentium]|nr:uracil permease [Faecalibaculum rodentium]
MRGFMAKKIYQVDEKVPSSMLLPLSIQHLFAMFGATVLVPFLFGINPAIVLLMNGIGTLLFIFITKGQAPAYLGSSFAFLAPGNAIIASFGYEYALGGFIAVGFCGCLLSFIIKKFGTDWISVVLPPAAMAPVVALIGLELAGSAASTAGLLGDSVSMVDVTVFLVTLAVAVIGSVCFRKFLAVIPILIAVIAGYVTALCFGAVDFSAFQNVGFFQMPNFTMPKFDINAVLMMLPVLLVIASEHIGHQIVTSQIVGRDLIKKPGLDKTLFADNFSTMISGFLGSVPTTTYGENIGVMALTGVYSVQVIAGAAIISIICAFIGPLSALIQTIPNAVIGGISFLLYGMIGVSGLRILIDEKVDFGNSMNMVLTSVVFVTGLSGITLTIGSVSLSGMILAALVAMGLSLLFFVFDKLGWINKEDAPEPENEFTVLADNIAAENARRDRESR